jgi:hypothetical protein
MPIDETRRATPQMGVFQQPENSAIPSAEGHPGRLSRTGSAPAAPARTPAPRTTSYEYDDENIILEYKSNNEITVRYTHGPDIDEPLAVEIKAGTTLRKESRGG